MAIYVEMQGKVDLPRLGADTNYETKQASEPKAYATMAEAFTSLTHSGSALPIRYEVMIYPPGAEIGKNGAAENAAMRCSSVTLPGKNLTTSLDANVYGVQPNIVDGVTFPGTANMVFTSSQAMRERKMFEAWQNLAWDKKSWNIGYYNDYVGWIDIFLLDNNFKRTYGIKLMEAFPKEIQGNDLSAAPATEALKLTVQIQYKYWMEITRGLDKSTTFEMIDP